MKNFFALGRFTAPKDGDDYDLDAYFLAVIAITLFVVMTVLRLGSTQSFLHTTSEKLVHSCSALEFVFLFWLMSSLDYTEDASYTAPLILIYITDATQIIFLILGQKCTSYIAECTISFCFIFKHCFMVFAVLTAANANFERDDATDEEVLVWSWSVFWFNCYFSFYGFILFLMNKLDIPHNVRDAISAFITGMWLAPLSMGYLGTLYFLLWFAMYYYVRGFFLPWKRHDFCSEDIYSASTLLGYGVSTIPVSESNMASKLRLILEKTPSLTQNIGVNESLDLLFSLIDHEERGKISVKQFNAFWSTFGMQWGSNPEIFSSHKRVKPEVFINKMNEQEKVMIAYAFGNLMHRLRQGNLIHHLSDGKYISIKSSEPIEVSVDELTLSSPKKDDQMLEMIVSGPASICSDSESRDVSTTAGNRGRSVNSIGGHQVEASFSEFDEFKCGPSVGRNISTTNAATDSGATTYRNGLRTSLESRGPDRSSEQSSRRKHDSLEVSRKGRISLPLEDEYSTGESLSPYKPISAYTDEHRNYISKRSNKRQRNRKRNLD